MVMDITEPEQIDEILNYRFKQSEISHNVQSVIKHKGEVMARVSKDEILEACIDGINTSFMEYLEWSGGYWLWNAPEYLITVNIFKCLSEIQKSAKYITLEDNVRDTLIDANINLQGNLTEEMRPNGRADIIFWWGNGTPRGIIEVKNRTYQKTKIQKDLNRIYLMLNENSNIEFGVTAFYIDGNYKHKNPTDTIEKRIKEEFISNIEQEIENNLQCRWVYKEIISDEKNAAYAVAIMIYK